MSHSLLFFRSSNDLTAVLFFKPLTEAHCRNVACCHCLSQARVNHVFVSQLLRHGNCYYCKQLAFQTKEDVWPFTIINSEKDSGIGMAGIWNAMSACTICAVFSRKFRPRAHVSGYFGIRNFFSPDTASVDTYPANPAYESTSCSFF